jgi:hypothetical protein
MRKLILSCFLPLLILSSCKKEQKKRIAAEEKNYAVNFNLSGFTQEVTSNTQRPNGITATNALPGSVKRLFYRVYNSSNILIRSIDQDSSTTSFGQIADKLPSGTYKIHLCAGNNITISKADAPSTALLGTRMFQGNLTRWSDAFAKNLSLTVNNGDLNQNVTMGRIVTKATVKILDQIPANANKLVIELDKDYNYYNLAAEAPNTTIYDIDYALKTRKYELIFKTADKATLNYTASVINLYTGNDVKVTISCYDGADKLIAQRVVNNVILQKNTQTIISGNLFTAEATPFTIGVNAAWDSGFTLGF